MGGRQEGGTLRQEEASAKEGKKSRENQGAWPIVKNTVEFQENED